MAVRDAALADAIARAAAVIDRGLILFGLPGSELVDGGRARGAANGAAKDSPIARISPTARSCRANEPGAVIDDPATVIPRVIRMARDHVVEAIDGTVDPAGGGHDLRSRRYAGCGRAGRAHSAPRLSRGGSRGDGRAARG